MELQQKLQSTTTWRKQKKEEARHKFQRGEKSYYIKRSTFVPKDLGNLVIIYTFKHIIMMSE
jgi:hypothetical protein